jgi:hypothetical protein
MAKCLICGTELNQPEDPGTVDCGGDCRRCMARVALDPDEIRAMREAEPGNPEWREDDQ